MADFRRGYGWKDVESKYFRKPSSGAGLELFHCFNVFENHEIQTMNKTSNDVESMGHSATGENELK